MSKIWVVLSTTANRNTDRTDETYICESKDVALKLFSKLRNNAINLLNHWSGNDFVTEFEEEMHFLGQDNHYDCWIELQVYEQKILTMEDVTAVEYYGRKWIPAKENYDYKNEEIWWLVVKIDNNRIYCDNGDGRLLLVKGDGTMLECYI